MSHQLLSLIPMKSLTVWHGHFTRPSLPAGTARKDSGHLSGRRPLHLANARPFGRLKAPLGLSLLRCAAQTRACRVAGGAGSHLRQRKTERSRWGTPCLTYRLWIFAGCVRQGAPCFCFVLNLLTRDFLPRFADILPVRRSESVLHTPEGHYR